MAVHYKILSRAGSVLVEKEQTACFGAMSRNRDFTTTVGRGGGGSRREDSAVMQKVVFYPNNHRILEDAMAERTTRWWSFLLSLPIVQDSLFEPPSGDMRETSFALSVRCDIPVDRLIGVMCLFRLFRTSGAITTHFCKLLDMDVEPEVAFAMSVGVLDFHAVGRLETVLECEESFVDAKHTPEADVIGLAQEFCSENWQEKYNGHQGLYDLYGTYVRGESWEGEEADTRLTGWGAPSQPAERDAGIGEDMVSFRQVVYTNVLHRIGLANAQRYSELNLTDSELLDIASYIENQLEPST